MIENALREKWNSGQATANGWLAIPSAITAELMAEQGYDSLCIDMQHGLVDDQAMVAMLQAMRASRVVPLVRVPWLEPGIVMKALDAGAYGVICPMVNTLADASRFASYVRYPPRGQRSFGPIRASMIAGASYATEANDQLLAIAMIETAEAVRNLEEIAATPGIDALYVGPADLSLNLSDGRLLPAFDREEPELIDTIRAIASACRRYGKFAGLHCGTADYAARAVGWGFHFVTIASDFRHLGAAAKASVERFHAQLAQGGSINTPSV